MNTLERIESKTTPILNRGSKFKCWIWQGSFTKDGHAQMEIEGRNRKVVPYYHHQLAISKCVPIFWNRLRRKSICTNKKCIQPHHFEPAPFAKKIMMKGVGKGRNPLSHPKPGHIQGTKNPKAKLDEQKVLEIRSKSSKGWSTLQLSKSYLVSETQIKRIISNQNWKHV